MQNFPSAHAQWDFEGVLTANESAAAADYNCFLNKYLILRGGRRERSYIYNPLMEETVWSNNEMRVICSDKSGLS